MKLSNLEAIFKAFNQARIRYPVAGGIAVNTHGCQRMTSGMDLVVQLDSDNITTAMNTLNSY